MCFVDPWLEQLVHVYINLMVMVNMFREVCLWCVCMPLYIVFKPICASIDLLARCSFLWDLIMMLVFHLYISIDWISRVQQETGFY